MKLPIISGRQVVRSLTKVGWYQVRQRGSHIILHKEGSQVTISVPAHKEVDRGTLHKIIRLAEITDEEFRELLR